jgi:ribosomal protein S18
MLIQKGLPLKVDPFFQFIKNNLKAREIYLKANDRFSVENVIDISLRQDIGADPSNSRIRSPDFVDTKGRADLLHELKDLREGKFNPISYDGPSKFTVQGAYDELKPHQPLRHYFKPLDRYEKRQQNLRQIKKYDIHWRNIELLRQFLTINGNIKSRYRSFLSDRDQRAVRTAIKTARIMGAMPYFGRTPEPLKRNITSLEDEVQEIGYQHVNLETGHLFQTRSRSMDSLEVEVETENDLDYKYKKMTEGNTYKIWVNNMEK